MFNNGRGWKILEKAITALLVLVCSPIMLFVVVVVYLNDRGPVVYKQLRIGINQQPFYMYKFRTMRVGAEEQHEALINKQMARSGSFLLHLPNDARQTKVGRWLRKFSLDELPQLFNVLAGNMALVGPRSMLPTEIGFLSAEQLRRFEILPGITGLAQVSGRSALDAPRYVELDLKLVDEMTPHLYIFILLKTPIAILSAKGAA